MSDATPTALPTNQHSETPRLALRPREAAKALGIGARLLWSLTNQKLIPHLRLGRTVVYPVASLEKWLSEQAEGNGTPRDPPR